MKQQGKCIIGNQRTVEDYTSDWHTVRMHPTTFYRHSPAIDETLEKIKGLYAELDMGQYILLRFSDKVDLTTFHRDHHSYI